MVRSARFMLAVCVPGLLSGCAKLSTTPTSNPLTRAQMSADSVALDIFYVSVPFGDENANAALWEEVDEQHLPLDVRQRLAANGFRAGVIGGQFPRTLKQLLAGDEKIESNLSSQIAQFTQEPKIRRRHLQLRAGLPGELIASETSANWPVLLASEGRVEGKSYSEAQGRFELRARSDGLGGVRIELVPELHHGATKPNIVASDGMWKMESTRSKEIYDQLRILATLAPGEMLLVASRPDKPGSLGHRFLTRENASRGREQRFVIIRLSQTQEPGGLSRDDPFDGLATFKIPDIHQPGLLPRSSTSNIPDADDLGLPEEGQLDGRN